MSIESALLAAMPDDMPAAASIIGALPEAPTVGLQMDEAGGFDLSEAAPVEYMDQAAFTEQWGQIHDLMGGMVQMRTGNPCPLGDQARGAGGTAAAAAAYALLSANEFTRNLFLSAQSTLIGQVMVIGMHGFACVQIVKASQAPQVHQ